MRAGRQQARRRRPGRHRRGAAARTGVVGAPVPIESTRALTQSLADTRIVLTDEAGAVLGAAEAGSRAVCAL